MFLLLLRTPRKVLKTLGHTSWIYRQTRTDSRLDSSFSLYCSVNRGHNPIFVKKKGQSQYHCKAQRSVLVVFRTTNLFNVNAFLTKNPFQRQNKCPTFTQTRLCIFCLSFAKRTQIPYFLQCIGSSLSWNSQENDSPGWKKTRGDFWFCSQIERNTQMEFFFDMGSSVLCQKGWFVLGNFMTSLSAPGFFPLPWFVSSVFGLNGHT